MHCKCEHLPLYRHPALTPTVRTPSVATLFEEKCEETRVLHHPPPRQSAAARFEKGWNKEQMVLTGMSYLQRM